MTAFLKQSRTLQRFLIAGLVLLMIISSISPSASAQETTTEETDKVLLSSGSEWNYLDTGSNPGSAWEEPGFVDSLWKSGKAPLGYPIDEKHGTFGDMETIVSFGDDEKNKHATTYFRTSFEVENLDDSNAGQITAGIDDGAILYLNGHEIGRYNLPDDKEIPYDSYGEDLGMSDANESDDKVFYLTADDMSHLVEGTNVLAAEVHQDRPSSSDLFFDLEFKSIFVDESIYQASAVSFAPGADETQFNFSWYSPATGEPGVIEYAKVTDGNTAEFPEEDAKTVAATLTEASSGNQANEVTITGLESSSEYVYRLGDDNGRWTEPANFKTRESDDYNFLFMGDPQIGSDEVVPDTEGWVETVNKAITKFPDTSFIQSAGDQVNDSRSEEEYEGWFAPELLKNYPTATTVGNHDNSVYYEYHFNTPNQNPELGNSNGSGGDYYFTYGDTLIMNLNSNNKNAAEHIQFMEETEAATADQDFKWKFVVFHHSIYSAASHSQESSIIKLREELVPTIDQLDIDAVLMGHDHSYVRTFQMQNLQPLKNQMIDKEGSVINPEGTVYLTGNSSSGSKYYGLKDGYQEYAAVGTQLETPTFMNVEVKPTSIEFTTYRTDTLEEMDSYKIIKDESIPVVLPELKEVKLEATGNVIPTEPSSFYPEVSFSVTGVNENGGPYDVKYENITYKTDQVGQLSVSSTGDVEVMDGANPGEVQVWAEVVHEGKTIETNKVGISIIEHTEKQLLKQGSVWKYLDNGSDQGTAWRQTDYDDSVWKSGAAPLGYPASEDHGDFGKIATIIGYGSDSANKYATSYFRTTFEVEDLETIGNTGLITAGIDDGAVIYLNGHEIGRYNLQEGIEVPYDGFIEKYGMNISNEDDNERFVLNESHLSYLVEGTNVLAVEVHQDRPSSSDVFMDMEFVTNVDNSQQEEIIPEKTLNFKNIKTGKLMIHKPSVSITVDTDSQIKNGIVFTGEYAEFHGNGFADTAVTIKPKNKYDGTIIDFKGTMMSKVIIDGTEVKEIRGAENVAAFEFINGADEENIQFNN